MNLFDSLKTQCKSHLANGLYPQIILDIDDTLIDCRYRKHRVYSDFISQAHIRQLYPAECLKLSRLSWQDVHYKVLDDTQMLNITNPDFNASLYSFWKSHYFTEHYYKFDIPFPGAITFVRKCLNMGIGIIYLSARDKNLAGSITYQSFQRLGFPCDEPSVHFILKEERQQSDSEFKSQSLDLVLSYGPVVAALENEMQHLNIMTLKFPKALMYWRNTLFSPAPPPPLPTIRILETFP